MNEVSVRRAGGSWPFSRNPMYSAARLLASSTTRSRAPQTTARYHSGRSALTCSRVAASS